MNCWIWRKNLRDAALECDIDPLARQAVAANATLNRVDVNVFADWSSISETLDVIIVADVLYDRENLPLLDQFISRAPEVLVADSRVKDFNVLPYHQIAQMKSSTLPDLDEFDEFRQVRLYHGLAHTGRLGLS